MGKRTTEADECENIHTPYRKLDQTLYLLIKDVNSSEMQLPHGVVQEGETLRQVSVKI